jgi:hypothetical protein
VLGATWKLSRIEIEQQKMLLITSLETMWVASSPWGTGGDLIFKHRAA